VTLWNNVTYQQQLSKLNTITGELITVYKWTSLRTEYPLVPAIYHAKNNEIWFAENNKCSLHRISLKDFTAHVGIRFCTLGEFVLELVYDFNSGHAFAIGMARADFMTWISFTDIGIYKHIFSAYMDAYAADFSQCAVYDAKNNVVVVGQQENIFVIDIEKQKTVQTSPTLRNVWIDSMIFDPKTQNIFGLAQTNVYNAENHIYGFGAIQYINSTYTFSSHFTEAKWYFWQQASLDHVNRKYYFIMRDWLDINELWICTIDLNNQDILTTKIKIDRRQWDVTGLVAVPN